MYSQEEVDDVIVVKVTDSQLRQYTHLTIAKFEERLADMRYAIVNDSMSLFDPVPFYSSVFPTSIVFDKNIALNFLPLVSETPMRGIG